MALAAAGHDSLKMLIAEVERKDREYGGGSQFGEFENFEVDVGDPSVTELYDSDGSACSDWIKKHINFVSINDGGMVLAQDDGCYEDTLCWDDGTSGPVEVTGNEGANRETMYKSCILIVYKLSYELEHATTQKHPKRQRHIPPLSDIEYKEVICIDCD